MQKTAVISDCGKFRYRLGRSWDASKPKLAFIMLNPSTADANVDDATIRRCIGFGDRLGFGAIEVGNLFAYRATKPKDLREAGYPEGPDNNEHLRAIAMECQTIVCAWGMNAANLPQPHKLIGMLRYYDRKPMALRVSNGVPHHPLMLPYNCELQELA